MHGFEPEVEGAIPPSTVTGRCALVSSGGSGPWGRRAPRATGGSSGSCRSRRRAVSRPEPPTPCWWTPLRVSSMANNPICPGSTRGAHCFSPRGEYTCTVEDAVMRRSVIGFMLTLTILVAPLLANAQPRGRVPRIGVLATTSPSQRGAFLDGFGHGLHELGWIEGQSIAVEWRLAEGKLERLPELAAELVRLNVDIIVASGTPASLAAKHATTTIP